MLSRKKKLLGSQEKLLKQIIDQSANLKEMNCLVFLVKRGSTTRLLKRMVSKGDLNQMRQ